MAPLLERWWDSRGRVTKKEDTTRTLLLMVLCSGSIITLNDVLTVDLDQVGRSSGYTRRSFEQFFRRVTGDTPASWFMKARLYGAWHELRRPGVRAAEVARRWGFPHAGRFSAYYRAAYGESPRDVLKRAGI